MRWRGKEEEHPLYFKGWGYSEFGGHTETPSTG